MFGKLKPLSPSLWTAECLYVAFLTVGFADLSRFAAKPLRRVVDASKGELASSLPKFGEIYAFTLFGLLGLRGSRGFGHIVHIRTVNTPPLIMNY
jgi:hypothetical protein